MKNKIEYIAQQSWFSNVYVNKKLVGSLFCMHDKWHFRKTGERDRLTFDNEQLAKLHVMSLYLKDRK